MTQFNSWSTWYHKYGSPVFLLTIIYLFPECVKWDVLQQREIVLKRLNLKGMAQNDNMTHVRVWLTAGQFQLQCKLKVFPYLFQTTNLRIPSNQGTKILEYRLAWCSTREYSNNLSFGSHI